jgi:hypothetical protein
VIKIKSRIESFVTTWKEREFLWENVGYVEAYYLPLFKFSRKVRTVKQQRLSAVLKNSQNNKTKITSEKHNSTFSFHSLLRLVFSPEDV